MRIDRALFAAALACAGCAASPPPVPEMSAKQHDAVAAQNEHEARDHAARYRPTAAQIARCTPEQAGMPGQPAEVAPAYAGCWTSEMNPTEPERIESERHMRLAAAHRAASKALRDAEERACNGIAPQDRDRSPFSHREDITTAEAIMRGAKSSQFLGAIVYFRARPGMTAGWLQRVIDCHIARNDAMGHVVPEMPYCPLVPAGASATVSPVDGGFAVTIMSSDPDGAREIARRAEALVSEKELPPTAP